MRRCPPWTIGWPAAVALLAGGVPAGAVGPLSGAGELPPGAGGPESAEGPVKVRLLTDAPRVGPGQTFHLAVVFDIEPKWHIYWKNPGEGAMPPVIAVEAPDGFEVGKTLWTRPLEKAGDTGPEYGYEKQTVLFVPITAPQGVGEGAVELSAEIKWAVCKDLCVLGAARRSVTVDTSSRPVEPGDRLDPLLVRFKKRVPGALEKLSGSSVQLDGTRLTVRGPAGGRSTVSFFPAVSPGVCWGPVEARVAGDRFLVAADVQVNPKNALGEPIVIGGLVALGSSLDDPCYDLSVPVQERPQ